MSAMTAAAPTSAADAKALAELRGTSLREVRAHISAACEQRSMLRTFGPLAVRPLWVVI